METDRWCLYKHTSPSGKVYIGIAKNVKHRWRGNGTGYRGSTRIWYAIQKYGWNNFTHEILAENLTREEASELEKKTIAQYKSTDPRYGYNLTHGGYDGTLCEASRQKLSHSLMGHPVSEEVKSILRKCHIKPIICLDTGEIYDSAADAARTLNICPTQINRCTLGKSKTANGLRFAKLSDYQNNTIPTFDEKPKGKKIVCIETGEIFASQTDAAKKYNTSSQSISHACTGKVETSCGLHWAFAGGS